MSDDGQSPQEDLESLLKSEIGECYASDLRAHIERDAVIVVDRALDLHEVALVVARDQSHQVQTWIAEGKLSKPTLPQVKHWKAEENLPFRSVIVRPYVLVQALFDDTALVH